MLTTEEIQKGIHSYLSESKLSESMFRRPLYGISLSRIVNGLKINGQLVDHVIEDKMHHKKQGEIIVQFWYISDFQYIPDEDIVITFEFPD